MQQFLLLFCQDAYINFITPPHKGQLSKTLSRARIILIGFASRCARLKKRRTVSQVILFLLGTLLLRSRILTDVETRFADVNLSSLEDSYHPKFKQSHKSEKPIGKVIYKQS